MEPPELADAGAGTQNGRPGELATEAGTLRGDGQTLPGEGAATVPGALPRTAAPQPIAPGSLIGPFVVERQLGAGAMGLVVLARDNDLGRRVAIKVLRSLGEGERARARLLREAQAVAQIQHPHVIAVHQVGTHREQIYVVMEYVDGGTLREWITRAPRTWPEVLEAYRQAGRGLAAAHAAGLVHRDFKPDNVLIGNDDRVRVTDFGLVGVAGETLDVVPPTDEELSLSGSDKLTRTGALLGTPAYMPVEQQAGLGADARSDQFAFCVSLYEGLYGFRPFTGDSALNVLCSIQSGEVRSAPTSEVPSRVHEAIVRGLSAEPGDRHANMNALLRALQPVASRRGWSRVAGGLAVAGAVGGAVAWQAVPGDDSAVTAANDGKPCVDAASLVGEAWSEARAASVRKVLVTPDRPVSAESFGRLKDELDAQVADWVATRNEACAATRVRGEHTESIFAQQEACFDAGLAELNTFTALLAEGDTRLADGALSSASLLRRAQTCADVEAVLAAEPPSDTQEPLLVELRQELTRARILLLAGRHQDVQELGRRLEARAREIGYGAAHARVLETLARAEMQTGEFSAAEAHAREASRLAGAARDYAVEARAAGTLVFVLATTPGRLDEAVGAIAGGESAVARTHDPRARTYFKAAAAMVHGRNGQVDEAMALANEVIAILEALDRPPPDELANAYANRGALHAAQGDLDASTRDLEQALSVVDAGLGKAHPLYGAFALSLGAALANHQHFERGLAWDRAALEAWELTYGRNHTSCALAQVYVGQALLGLEDLEGAKAAFADAKERHTASGTDDPLGLISILDNGAHVAWRLGHWEDAKRGYLDARAEAVRSAGEADPRVATYDEAHASVLMSQGQSAAAMVPLRAARAALVSRHGPKHQNVARLSMLLGDVERAQGKCDAALEHYRSALRVHNDLELGADATRVQLLSGTGLCELATGDARTARETLEHAHRMMVELGLEGERVAEVRFALAQERAARGETTGAVELASGALEAFEALGPSASRRADEVRAWLESRRSAP